jgi:uncharacterized protein YukE
VGKIDIKYNESKKQADDLQELSEQLRKLARNEFAAELGNLARCWKGDNARKYSQKGEQLQKHIEQAAMDLRKTAEELRSAAKRIYDADMLAKRLAEERSYR